jgi:hypothetical protein
MSAKPDSTLVVQPKADTASVEATPMNCYKQWLDYFSELGSKTVTDGMQLVVIAFKSKESCHCYMGIPNRGTGIWQDILLQVFEQKQTDE